MLRLCLIAFSVCCATSALAQDTTQSIAPAAANPSLRYSFNHVDNGFLRLDNQTGQVTFCSARSVGWACEAVPEDRAALDKEIGRLQDENAALKAELAVLRAPPSGDTGKDQQSELKLKLPSNEDIQRARDFLEDTWRRLVEMIVAVQKDMLRRG